MKGWFWFILTALLLIFVQTVFEPFQKIPLAGAAPAYKEPELNVDSWFDGQYQKRTERKLTATFGFRENFIRVWNQLRYSLFNEVNPQVVIGADGYLFEAGYQKPLCGDDLLPQSKIEQKVDSLQMLSELLEQQGKQLYVFIAPNKWRFHAELAPKSCEWTDETNYTRFKSELEKSGVSTIDCIELFEEWKADSEYALYAHQGTHWSIFGGWKAALELRNRLAADGFDLPKIEVSELEETSKPRNTDKDLQELLNVMQPPAEYPLAYPKLTAVKPSNTKAIIIGDSYYWTFIYLDLHEKLWADDSPFLYYNRSRVLDYETKVEIDDAQRLQWLDEADVVIIMTHEPSLPKLGYGFQRFAIPHLAQQGET